MLVVEAPAPCVARRKSPAVTTLFAASVEALATFRDASGSVTVPAVTVRPPVLIWNGRTPLYSTCSAPFSVSKRRRLSRPVEPMSSATAALSARVIWSTPVRSRSPLMSGEITRSQFVPGAPPAVTFSHSDTLPASVRIATDPRGAEITASGEASVL
jgi:hypothetical protein